MLKTNSKKAIENIRAYIVDHTDFSNYEKYENIPVNISNFKQVARIIYDTFQSEKFYDMEYVKWHKMTLRDVFIDWCAGLPSMLDTCYYYNRSAVDDIAGILEETEAEKAKYTEDQAELLLSKLIYREIVKAI